MFVNIDNNYHTTILGFTYTYLMTYNDINILNYRQKSTIKLGQTNHFAHYNFPT